MPFPPRTASVLSLLVLTMSSCGARTPLDSEPGPSNGQRGSPSACPDPGCDCTDVTCPPGTTCATSIGADMVDEPADWTFNGTASWEPGAGALTTDGHSEAGTIVYKNPIYTDAFVLSFEVSLGDGDGAAFMLETSGPNAVGKDGGGLAVAGLGGYGIELDTYPNSECGDPDDDHLGVDELSTACGLGIAASTWTTPLAAIGVDLHDGQWHSVQAHLHGSAVDLTVDGVGFPTVLIPGWKNGQMYWYGFGGATGQATGVQRIRKVEVQFSTPRCL